MSKDEDVMSFAVFTAARPWRPFHHWQGGRSSVLQRNEMTTLDVALNLWLQRVWQAQRPLSISQSLLCQQGSQLSTWRSAEKQWPYGLTSMLVHEVTVSVQFKLSERKFTFRRIYRSSRCSLCLKVASLLKSIISPINQRNGRRLGLRKETTNPSTAGVGKTIHPHNLRHSICRSRVGFLPSQLENCEKDNQPFD